MLTRIEKPLWQRYFDRVSTAIGEKQIEIEVVGPDIGAQQQATHVPLTGLSYDDKDDIFVVFAGDGFEHNISHPQEIHIDQERDALLSLEVVDSSGDHHIVTLNEPLPLPSPASASH